MLTEEIKNAAKAWHYVVDQWIEELRSDEPINGADFLETFCQAFEIWNNKTEQCTDIMQEEDQ